MNNILPNSSYWASYPSPVFESFQDSQRCHFVSLSQQEFHILYGVYSSSSLVILAGNLRATRGLIIVCCVLFLQQRLSLALLLTLSWFTKRSA
jgi:hypothetical protein